MKIIKFDYIVAVNIDGKTELFSFKTEQNRQDFINSFTGKVDYDFYYKNVN